MPRAASPRVSRRRAGSRQHLGWGWEAGTSTDPCYRAQDQGRPICRLPPVELFILTKKRSNGLLFFKALVNYSYLK